MPKEDEQSKPTSQPAEDKRDGEASPPTPPPEQRRLRGYDRLEEAVFSAPSIGVLPVNFAEPDDLGPVTEPPPDKDPEKPAKE